jgi:hypothetical protein
MANQTAARGTPFSATASGTTSAQAVTTIKPTTQYWVTDISGSSTGTAGTWVIFGGINGTTPFYQGAGVVNTPFSTPIEIVTTGTISFFMNGATATFANLSGYFI